MRMFGLIACLLWWMVYKIKLIVIGFAITTRYCSYKADFYEFDWFLMQFTLLMNCMLGSTIHLGPDEIMIVGVASYTSRYIYHFRIIHYQEGLFFERGSIKKL